jgi:hypothetical protein
MHLVEIRCLGLSSRIESLRSLASDYENGRSLNLLGPKTMGIRDLTRRLSVILSQDIWMIIGPPRAI